MCRSRTDNGRWRRWRHADDVLTQRADHVFPPVVLPTTCCTCRSDKYTCASLAELGWCDDTAKHVDNVRARCPVTCGTCPPKPTSAPYTPVVEDGIVALNRGGTRVGDTITYTAWCSTPPCKGVGARLSVVYGAWQNGTCTWRALCSS